MPVPTMLPPPSNEQHFLVIYTAMLQQDIVTNPSRYRYPLEKASEVAAEMVALLKVGSGASKEGTACRLTCKALGVKHTYKAIRAYLNG